MFRKTYFDELEAKCRDGEWVEMWYADRAAGWYVVRFKRVKWQDWPVVLDVCIFFE
jgi:hypothetical protein